MPLETKKIYNAKDRFSDPLVFDTPEASKTIEELLAEAEAREAAKPVGEKK